jgi:hypothetical protein
MSEPVKTLKQQVAVANNTPLPITTTTTTTPTIATTTAATTATIMSTTSTTTNTTTTTSMTATGIHLPKILPRIVPKKEIKINLPKIDDIYHLIQLEIHQKVLTAMTEMIDKISLDHGLNATILHEKYLHDLKVIVEKDQDEVKKIGTNAPRKPRQSLDPLIRCAARVANGDQCSRKRQVGNGYEYCGSHQSNQPYGRIDEPRIVVEEEKKRGRGRPPKKESQQADDSPVDTPYQDTTGINCSKVTIGNQEYILDRKTMIIYEEPDDNVVNSIEDLTRVGTWDSANNEIIYDSPYH